MQQHKGLEFCWRYVGEDLVVVEWENGDSRVLTRSELAELLAKANERDAVRERIAVPASR